MVIYDWYQAIKKRDEWIILIDVISFNLYTHTFGLFTGRSRVFSAW
jgi:uncharacterized membrane protein